MRKTGTASLPLHGGKAPRWLFVRMVRLGRAISLALLEERGAEEFLRRLSDPFWFQALGCTLGFDWHSSGVTTTVCGALKEALAPLSRETGFFVAGGKGKASRRTPSEILASGDALSVDPEGLVRCSRLSAKVDSAAVQDGYEIYHHTFFFTADGRWAVIQQGMNEETRYARRYHWLGEAVSDFACEPHAAVCCDARGEALNLVAAESEATRRRSVLLARESPAALQREAERLKSLVLPPRHAVLASDLDPARLGRVMALVSEAPPRDFAALLATRGVGGKTLRALALISELVWGDAPSFRDPARFSFAHGGKDGHPYPVDRATYDSSIAVLKEALRKARLARREKMEAFSRLATWLP